MCVISLMLKNDIFYKSLQWPGARVAWCWKVHDNDRSQHQDQDHNNTTSKTRYWKWQKKRILHQFVVLNFSFNRKIHFIQQGAFMPPPAILWPCHPIDRDIFWTPCPWQSCLMDDWQPGDKSNQFSNGPGSGPGRGPAPGTRAAEGGRGEGRRPHRRRAAALAVRREEALLNWRLVPRDG